MVNRDRSEQHHAGVSFSGFACDGTSATTLQLVNLPADRETFVSHEQNALADGTVALTGASFPIDLPALSVTAVLLRGKAAVRSSGGRLMTSRNTVSLRNGKLFIDGDAGNRETVVALYSLQGVRVGAWRPAGMPVVIPLQGLAPGRYVVRIDEGRFEMPVMILR